MNSLLLIKLNLTKQFVKAINKYSNSQYVHRMYPNITPKNNQKDKIVKSKSKK